MAYTVGGIICVIGQLFFELYEEIGLNERAVKMAVPVTLIVWLIFNSMWFNQHRNFLIISLLMWVGLGTIFITFFVFGINIPKIFLLGIPAQIIIALWSGLKKISKKN